MINFNGKNVLIVGGTQSLGLATALAFAKFGAQCILIDEADIDENAIRAHFTAQKLLEPKCFKSAITNPKEIEALFTTLKSVINRIDVYVCHAMPTHHDIFSLADYSLDTFKQSLSHSAWPLFSFTEAINKHFGQYPRYAIGLTSMLPDSFSYGADYTAISAKVMEVMCRYMTYRLRDLPISMNIVHAGLVRSGMLNPHPVNNEFITFAEKCLPEHYWVTPEEVGESVVALASGYLDSFQGQIVHVDRGLSFFGNLMDLYARRNDSKLKTILNI